MPVDIRDVENLVRQQEEWRGRQTINLIASENAQSRAVRDVQNSDFMARYAEGHPNEDGKVNRYYQGTRFIDEIERAATREICELFDCRQADVRPISGNAANTAIALGLLRGGDTVIVNSTDAGGHISHNLVGVFGRRIQMRGQTLTAGRDNSVRLHFFPLSEDRYRMDAKGAVEMVDRLRPQLVVLGKSLFLFPEPLKELVPVCRQYKIPILFDGAHVLGLIAGGEFQDPLREGATYLTGSTHKTFPGPQRGVILADLEGAEAETYLGPRRSRRVPGVVEQPSPSLAAGAARCHTRDEAARSRLCESGRPQCAGARPRPLCPRDLCRSQGSRLHEEPSDRRQRRGFRRRRSNRRAPRKSGRDRQLQHAPRRCRSAKPLGLENRSAGDDSLRDDRARDGGRSLS